MVPSSTNSSGRGSLMRLATIQATRSPTVVGLPLEEVRGRLTLCLETLSKRISRPPLKYISRQMAVGWQQRALEPSKGKTYVNSTVTSIFAAADSEVVDAITIAAELARSVQLVLL